MSKRWLTLLLLTTLGLLLTIAWPHGGQRGAELVADKWSLPDPMADKLFEDFSDMPSQGPPAQELPSLHQRKPPLKRGRSHGVIALIIDDIGYDLERERALLAMPFPLAVSVLPEAPHAKRAADMAHAAGRVVMLHLPMEPSNPKLRAGMDDSFLRLGMSAAALRNRMVTALSHLHSVEGVNNHMGSLLTADRKAMRVVMAECRKRNLFFVDSRTGARSVAADEARVAGIRWASRQVFLDHIDDSATIAKAWRHAVLIADHRGSCVVIAHPRRRTVAFLATLTTADRARMRPVTDLLQ
ncbi:MAG: divergent polysaccharide deacetylase family protein [Mariprofundales bacterium]|nr:divergent polysaccharide deacetylase family protein [Mariprofundales bacterium]